MFQAHPQAQILVVGQAPGTAVHKTGIPFNDPSGKRLRTWMGVTPEVFYDARQIAIVPMGFCYPGRGKGGDLPPRKECAAAWREQLLSFMPNIRVTLVLGRHAIDWHLKPGRDLPLTQIVADWQEYWPDFVPLPHPSPRNTRWLRDNPWVEQTLVPKLQDRIRALLESQSL